jgi:hypothetical protein
VSALARTFKVIESLASYILLGVGASRVAGAAATELVAVNPGPAGPDQGALPIGG